MIWLSFYGDGKDLPYDNKKFKSSRKRSHFKGHFARYQGYRRQHDAIPNFGDSVLFDEVLEILVNLF